MLSPYSHIWHSVSGAGVGVFWGWLYGLFPGRDSTYTIHFYHLVFRTNYLELLSGYLCVINFDLVGESSVSAMILYFIILWLVGCVPLDMTYMRTISSIFLYFPTFVFSHLVFRDGAFCGRLTCLGWVTYANHFYNPLHSLANLGSE